MEELVPENNLEVWIKEEPNWDTHKQDINLEYEVNEYIVSEIKEEESESESDMYENKNERNYRKEERSQLNETAQDYINYLPNNLEVRLDESGIQYGVWSKSEIPIDQIYGPIFEGQQDEESFLEDLEPLDWTCYIKSSNEKGKTNLDSFYCEGKLYYRTFQKIPPETEMILFKKLKQSKNNGENHQDIQNKKNVLIANSKQKNKIYSKSISCKQYRGKAFCM